MIITPCYLLPLPSDLVLTRAQHIQCRNAGAFELSRVSRVTAALYTPEENYNGTILLYATTERPHANQRTDPHRTFKAVVDIHSSLLPPSGQINSLASSEQG